MQSKAPAFQCYPNDYMNKEEFILMNAEERGVFFTALMYSWKNGSLPTDLNLLPKLLSLDQAEIQRSWPKVSALFIPVDSQGYRVANDGLEKQRKEKSKFHKALSVAGQRGAQRRWENLNTDGQIEDGQAISQAIARPHEGQWGKDSSSSSTATTENKKPPFIPPEGEQPPSSKPESLPEGFVQFWQAYPRHENRKKCVEWWKRHKPNQELLDRMLAAIARQKSWQKWREGYIPHPSTWLTGERWNDEEPVRPGSGPTCCPPRLKPLATDLSQI